MRISDLRFSNLPESCDLRLDGAHIADRLLVGPLCPRQAPAKIDELMLGDIYPERADRVQRSSRGGMGRKQGGSAGSCHSGKNIAPGGQRKQDANASVRPKADLLPLLVIVLRHTHSQ